MQELLQALLAAYHSKLQAGIDLELAAKTGDPLAEEMATKLCDVGHERVQELEGRWHHAMREEADPDKIARQRSLLSSRFRKEQQVKILKGDHQGKTGRIEQWVGPRCWQVRVPTGHLDLPYRYPVYREDTP